MADRILHTWGDWWGSEYCLVRSERPSDLPHEIRQNGNIRTIVGRIKEQAPGKAVQLGEPRPNSENGRIEIPLMLLEGWAVDKAYLEWAERYGRPDSWGQITFRGGEYVGLVGMKDGEDEPVAIVAGRRL